MKRFILFSILSIFLSPLFAQNSNYTILAKSGEITYANKAVYVGQVINDAQPLNVKAGAYVGLIHESGKPIEIKSEGSYDHDKLAGLLGSSEGTFSDQFASFMANEMSENDGNYKAGLGITGSVERGLESNKLYIPLPKKSKIVGEIIHVEWLSEDKIAGPYLVEVMNMSEEVIYTQTADSNHFDLKAYGMANVDEDDLYLLKISKENSTDESNVVCFYLPAKDENSEVSKELAPLLTVKSNVLETLASAKMLSEKGYHFAALKQYSIAKTNDKTGVAKESFSAYLEALK